MKMHFSEEIWVDLARGTVPTGTAPELERHLTTQCRDCHSTLKFWQQIANFGLRERECSPPENLVHLVKTEFTFMHAKETESPMVATLLFDSTAQPFPVGLRSRSASTRQMVYEAEGLTVDVRFERHHQRNLIAASGQVLDKESPLDWLGNAAVVLWTNEGRMVSKTETNHCGEFQLEFPPQDQLRLSVITQGRKTLRIVLGNLE